MEQSNINTDMNDRWSHAISAEQKINTKSRIAEYEFMKELFDSKLPVGEQRTEIDSYLQRLEQAIVDNEPIENEQFPPERSEPDPETGKPISYKYYSTSLLKQRAIGGGGSDIGSSIESLDHLQSEQQSVDSPALTDGHQECLQSESTPTQDQSLVAEHQD